MNQCCANFSQDRFGTRRKDPLIECFEENLKLKAFYQLLRSAKPRPCKKHASKLTDNRCFCEKKRAMQAEQIRKQNELNNQKELLLLQCMCASMGPLRQKLKEVKNKDEEVNNLKDRILKQCLCSAIEIILKTKRKIALEKKRNALRAQLNKRHIQFQQPAEKNTRKSDITDIERCCRHYALVAAKQYHRKMIRSQNGSPTPTSASESESGNGEKMEDSDFPQNENKSSIQPRTGSLSSRNSRCEKARNKKPINQSNRYNRSDISYETEISKRESRNRSKKYTPTSSKRYNPDTKSQTRAEGNKFRRTGSFSSINSSRGNYKRASSCEPNSSRHQSRDMSKKNTSPSSRQSIQVTNLTECVSMYRDMICKKPQKEKQQRMDSSLPNNNYKSQLSYEPNSSLHQTRDRPKKYRCAKRTGSSSSYETNRSRNQSRDTKKNTLHNLNNSNITSPTNSGQNCPEVEKEEQKRRGCCKRKSKSDASPETKVSRENPKSSKKSSPKSSRQSSADSKKKAQKVKPKQTLYETKNSQENPYSSKRCSSTNSRQSSPDPELQVCASKCLRKCCRRALRRRAKRESCNSKRNSDTSDDINSSQSKGEKENMRKKQTPQLRGGCDYKSSSSSDRSRASSTTKKKPNNSGSTDTMNSTRFRGRWFFRGKDTLVHQNFLPPRSSMKSPTHSKTSDDRKRLRFNPKRDHCRDDSIISRNFIPSSDLSTDQKDQHKINPKRRTDRSKSPPSSDREKFLSATSRSPKLPRSYDWLKEVKRQLKRSRQKGGETTDTDQKCKKNNRFMSKMAVCCRSRKPQEESYPEASSSNASICVDEPEDNKMEECQKEINATQQQFMPETSECKCSVDKEQQTEASQLRSSAAIHEMRTDIPRDISSPSLMSDLSLTKVYKDLLVMLRPDLLSENDNEQTCKETHKKRKVSIKKKSDDCMGRDSQKTYNKPSSIRLYLLQSPNEPTRRAKRRRNTRRSSCKRTQPFGGAGATMPRIMICKSQAEAQFPAMSDQSTKKASKKPKSLAFQQSQGCPIGCGQRKVRVNYLDPERWASLKKNLKMPKNPKPLPEDFILDTRVSTTDAEVERCRKQKRQRQLDEWQKELQRKKLESDPFYCPEIQTSSAAEKPGSEVYYVCRPVQTANSTEGACVYECCYCPNPESLGNEWKEIDPKIVVNCDQQLSVSANAKQKVNCAPSRRSECLTAANSSKCISSSSEERSKSPQSRFSEKCSSNSKSRKPSETYSSQSSECCGSSPKKSKNKLATDSLENCSRPAHPKKGQKKLPSPEKSGKLLHSENNKKFRNRGMNIEKRKRNADRHSSQKAKFQQSSSKRKCVSQSSSISSCPQVKNPECQSERVPSPCLTKSEPSSKCSMAENSYTPMQNRKSNDSICQSYARHQEHKDEKDRKDIIKACQCDCEACRKSAVKIDVDRQRIQSFKQQTQYQNEQVLKQNSIGCTCSLCNNGCCLFNTIENHFIICQQNKPRESCTNERKPENEESCQESCSEKTAASMSSSSGKQINQRHSWCCTDDFFMMCNKTDSDTENNYDTNAPNCSCNIKTKPHFNLVRDNCYKSPKCTNSADPIEPAYKRNCLYLWVPKCAEDGDGSGGTERNLTEENICTKNGTFFQVVKVKSDELGFLTQNRQKGGTSEKNMSHCTQDIQLRLKRKRAVCSKSVKKQVFCYKVKCQQEEPNQKKINRNSTKELLVTACQLQRKQSSTPGPVKIKISESMRPKEENNLSNCLSSKNAFKTGSVQRK